nr:hypothetical protein [Candidatus Gracilibacteria bacterium]
TGGLDYILAVPSIINGDIQDVDLMSIITKKQLVYNNYTNLPDSYKNLGYSMTGGFDFIPNKLVVYSGSTQDLLQDSNKLIFIGNLKQAYSGTIIQNNPTYKEIINTDTISNQVGSITLVNDYITNGIGGLPKVTENQLSQIVQYNCATQPTYTNATFITGTPTQANQAWQNTNNANPCYYTCINGYSGNDCSTLPITCNYGEDGSSGVCKDPYWTSVKLLMHMDGTNNSTIFTDEKSHTFSNLSPSTTNDTFIITDSGTGCIFGGACFKTGLNYNYNSIVTNDSTDFELSNQDFTIEFWYKGHTNTPWYEYYAATIIGKGYGGHPNDASTHYHSFWIMNYNNGGISLSIRTGTALYGIGVSINSTIAQEWHYYSFTRSGTTLYAFMDGVLKATNTVPSGTTVQDLGAKLTIGGLYGYASDTDYPRDTMRGYVDEIRYTKGVARYTSTYSLPIQPFPNQ